MRTASAATSCRAVSTSRPVQACRARVPERRSASPRAPRRRVRASASRTRTTLARTARDDRRRRCRLRSPRSALTPVCGGSGEHDPRLRDELGEDRRGRRHDVRVDAQTDDQQLPEHRRRPARRPAARPIRCGPRAAGAEDARDRTVDARGGRAASTLRRASADGALTGSPPRPGRRRRRRRAAPPGRRRRRGRRTRPRAARRRASRPAAAGRRRCRRCGPGRGDMTTTRSERNTASGMEWVTKTTAAPVSAQIRTSSFCMRSRVISSSAPNGSSISSSRGRSARARAIATRCCMPPESWSG